MVWTEQRSVLAYLIFRRSASAWPSELARQETLGGKKGSAGLKPALQKRPYRWRGEPAATQNDQRDFFPAELARGGVLKRQGAERMMAVVTLAIGDASCIPHRKKEVHSMPTAKEFTVWMDDRPGTLGKICRTLADRNINILATQSFSIGGKSVVRFVFDNPMTARSVLESERLSYTEAEVAQVKLAHRPGELARAAQRLGDASININYLYCGIEPSTNIPLIFFGVADAAKAAPILEQAAAAAGQS